MVAIGVAVGIDWRRPQRDHRPPGFIYLGAFMALRSRRGSLAWAVAAGLLASLAFYTRLNNLPMAAGIALFALSARVPLSTVLPTAACLAEAKRRRRPPGATMIAWRTLVAVPAVLAPRPRLLCLEKLALSTDRSACLWRQLAEQSLALWQPGMPFAAVVPRWIDSVLMVITVRDPPQFDWKSLPVSCSAPPWRRSLCIGVPRLP